MKGFLLDTNVFNHLVEGKIEIKDLPQGFPLFITHLQRRELMNCPDVEKKAKLMSLINILPKHYAPLQTCLAGVMCAGDRVGNGKIYREIYDFLCNKNKKRTRANTYDALIGEVAIINKLILITNDQLLTKKVRELGGEVKDHLAIKNKVGVR